MKYFEVLFYLVLKHHTLVNLTLSINFYIPTKWYKQTIFMERNYCKKQLFIYISSLVILSFSVNVNFDVAKHYFMQNMVLQNYADFAFFDQSWSAIIATILLLFVYHKYTARKIIAFLSIIYIFTQVNMIVSINENMIRIYYFLLTTSGMALYVFLLSLMLVGSKLKNETNIIIFFLTLIFGFLLSEVAGYYLLMEINSATLNRAMGINIFPIFLLISIFVINSSFVINKRKQLSDFLLTLKFSELEAMIIFSIFFTLMTLFEGRAILESEYSLVYFTDSSILYYFCFAMIISIYPITHFTKTISHHYVILVSLLILLFLFATMSLWIGYKVIGGIMWIIMGFAMYLLFLRAIVMLLEKFQQAEKFGVLMLIFFIGSAGVYIGHFSIEGINQQYGIQNSSSTVPNLLISIVIGVVFVYYLFRFVKDKMYEL